MSLAVPKPPKTTKKSSSSGPKLTEFDLIEIGEKIEDAIEYGTTVTITTYRNKRFEKFTGVIKSGNPNTRMLTMDIGEIDDIKISVNIIVDVK
ncbi:YolD-like family protein [Siminovitchia sp. FSL W7-1587]|uniref:YolD-like family protein n=1 Tax=Siminovitchia sp. FSL W7-1587 TaxID=2954699 RepID=UPI0030CCE486